MRLQPPTHVCIVTCMQLWLAAVVVLHWQPYRLPTTRNLQHVCTTTQTQNYTSGIIHTAYMPGLEPDTAYDYQVTPWRGGMVGLKACVNITSSSLMRIWAWQYASRGNRGGPAAISLSCCAQVGDVSKGIFSSKVYRAGTLPVVGPAMFPFPIGLVCPHVAT
jgi:hypothetical protein